MNSELTNRILDPRLKSGAYLVDEGRKLARDWRLGRCLFLLEKGVSCEAEWKRKATYDQRIMQHAHIGFRNVGRTVEGIRSVYEDCRRGGVTVDRFGITLDWSMGYPMDRRNKSIRGTGIVLSGPEDFASITNAAPAACHFGDFMLGLPGAVENTCGALAAGCSSFGNIGQYFTFRLPYWDDDVATTEATVTALGLLAAQDQEILVHSNLDDGFAGLFLDMSCSIGMAIIEKHIVETLIGVKISHCYGHHFSDPLSRAAFHCALVQVSDTPGTMIFGNTVAYQSTAAGNYASLATYLLADILSLSHWPSGHAINPVPVTENIRIPEIDEIVDAQTFASRLVDHAPFYDSVMDWSKIEAMAGVLVQGGQEFAARTLTGLNELGVPTDDPAALLLAIRRMGPKRIEAEFGPGLQHVRGRKPLVHAEWARELDRMAENWLSRQALLNPEHSLTICFGTTDVHEHGKYLVEQALSGLGVNVVDAGIAVDAELLVKRALEVKADAIAISTYNGVALSYAQAVRSAMESEGISLPVLVGGRLNQIPEDSNSGLPVDVTDDIASIGCLPCAGLDDMLSALRTLSDKGAERKNMA